MTQALLEKLKNSNKDLTKGQVEGILYLLLQEEKLTSKGLVMLTGLPKTVVNDFLVSLGSSVINEKGFVHLTESGQTLFKELNPQKYEWTFIKPNVTELASKHEQLRNKYFFSQKREFDQFFATAETSIRKALAIKTKSTIKGNKIALLGDDDLLSFAIPLIDYSYSEIVVFDIDNEQLSKIEQAVEKEGFKNIKVYKYDAKDPIPSQYQNYFDIVFTDPPYTKSGFDLFLDRCIELAKISKNYDGSHIYTCYGIGLKNLERETKLLESIHNRNLYLEDKLFKYNRYQGAETVGSASSLYVLKTTPFTSIIQNPNIENIYTFENVKEEKFPFVDHYVFKLYDVDASLLKSKTKLTSVLGLFCQKHKLKVMNTYITHFKPFGFSVTYILANSNLVAHTWEEFGAVHIDLVTCSPVFNASSLPGNLKTLFKARNVDYYKVN